MVKKYKKTSEISYTLGITLTIELLKLKPNLVTRVFVHSKFERNETYLTIESLCKKEKIEIIENDKVFNILSDKENCFVIGEFKKFECKLEKNKNHVVLVNPSNSGNLGTIIRSMVGFNLKNLAIIKPGVDIFDPKTVRASMGALFHLEFTYFDSFEDYKKLFTEHNYYPFMLKAKSSLSEVKFKEPFSLIFGNEATGLPDEFLNIGSSIIIKHSHDIDSLNLPIATSIAIYEATKNKFN